MFSIILFSQRFSISSLLEPKKDRKILTLDSMQGVTAAEIQAGAGYLSIMEQNLEVLREALN